MAKSKAILLAALLAGGLMGCDQLKQAADKGEDVAHATMKNYIDLQCRQSIAEREADYEEFGDARLLPFDCDGDGKPDF